MVRPDLCSVPLCDRPVRPGCELCDAHQKRKERGKGKYAATRIREAHLPAGPALGEAALAYAEASAEDDAAFLRARRRLQLAALAYAAEVLGKKP